MTPGEWQWLTKNLNRRPLIRHPRACPEDLPWLMMFDTNPR